MNTNGADAKSLLEKQLDEMYLEADRGAKQGRRVAALRRIAAYLLKGIAAGSGLIVGFNLLPEYNQYFGIASVTAVFLDTLTQNYSRLIATVRAGNAFYFLKMKVMREFNIEYGTLLGQVRIAGAVSETDEQKELDLQRKAADQLHAGLESIRKALADADLKALEALSLDAERAANELAKVKPPGA